MRARLAYLARSPRTPQRIAQRTTEGLVLVAGVAGLVATSTGLVSHVVFGAMVALGQLVGAA